MQSNDKMSRAEEKRHSLEDPEFRDLVSLRAYERWQRRGRPDGDGSEDWFAALRELEEERQASDRPRASRPTLPQRGHISGVFWRNGGMMVESRPGLRTVRR